MLTRRQRYLIAALADRTETLVRRWEQDPLEPRRADDRMALERAARSLGLPIPHPSTSPRAISSLPPTRA